jgi:hypothetical protein
MTTALFPKIRVTPEAREMVVSVLRPGETISSFIRTALAEEAVLRKAKERRDICRENTEWYLKSRTFGSIKRFKIQQFEYTINAKILQMRIEELACCK